MSHPGLFDDEGLTGVRVGVVTDTDDPENRGRVRLRFPWRAADDESRWARVAAPMAGPECGAQFRPAVDDEVLVAFADGDIHRPFVLGSLWSDQRVPPESGGSSGDTTVRTITSRSGHRVDFEDGPDGGIEITTAGGHRITLDDEGERIELTDGDNSVVLDGANGSVEVTATDRLTLSGSTVELDAEQGVEIGGKRLALSAASTLSLDSKGQLQARSTGSTTLKATGPLSLSGSLISLN